MSGHTSPRAAGAAPLRRILCCGGHDFTGRPENRALTDLVASLAKGAANGTPRVCLLPTASGDPADQIARFSAAFADRGCEPSHVSLFRLSANPISLRDHLLSQDLIYVGGGSMVNLLAVWDAHDVAAIMRLAWARGVVICGQSAGAMCWFEAGISKGSGAAGPAAGLGMLPGTCCVHYHSEPQRRAVMLESVARDGRGGYGIDDGAALLWVGRLPAGVFSARQGSTVYRVRSHGGRVVESPLAATAIVPETADGVAADIAEFRRSRRIRGHQAAQRG